METPALTLYYDGRCPFCVAEMRRLHEWNTARHLAFVDIARPGFDPAVLGTDLAALNRELHSLTGDGKVLVGIDSMLAAYTLVDRAWMVWPLRVRLLRPLMAWLYRGFAKHRYRMSALLGYRVPPACDGATCSIGNPFLK